MKTLRVLVASGALLVSGGCFLQKKPVVRVPVAPPPAAAPAPVAPQPAPEEPVSRPPVATTPAPQPAGPVTQPAKPSPFPPVSSPKPTTTGPRPVPVSPTPTPTLGAILSADQRQQLDTAYQADLRQANAVLSKVTGRSLTADQTATVTRARAFIRQAAQFHDRDLTTAAELARRARVLTQDLAGALR